MRRAIVWRPAAEADLFELYDWIADQAGRDVALRYSAGIEDHAASFSEFSERGTPRDDLAPGIRTTVYRGRTTIAYRVLTDAVEIVRLAHAGRDLGRLFSDQEE